MSSATSPSALGSLPGWFLPSRHRDRSDFGRVQVHGLECLFVVAVPEPTAQLDQGDALAGSHARRVRKSVELGNLVGQMSYCGVRVKMMRELRFCDRRAGSCLTIASPVSLAKSAIFAKSSAYSTARWLPMSGAGTLCAAAASDAERGPCFSRSSALRSFRSTLISIGSTCVAA